MIYCTLPNPAIDSFYPVESLAPGTTVCNVSVRSTPSGKGLNVAQTVKTLGEEVCVAGIVPERDRERFQACLDARDIRSHFITIPGDARSTITILEQKSGQTTRLCSAGPVAPPRVQSEFVRFAAKNCTEGDLWCCTGSIPPGCDDDLYAQLIKLCKEAGASTFLDARGRPLRLGVRAKPLAVKPNIAELEDLFGEQVKGVRHIALKAKKLLDRGVAFAFISLGSDGMIAVHDNDCLLCVPPQVRNADTTGCGDALMGGLLVAWARKFSFSEICRMAIACGTSKAMHEGAGDLSLEEVWQLMEDVKITAV